MTTDIGVGVSLKHRLSTCNSQTRVLHHMYACMYVYWLRQDITSVGTCECVHMCIHLCFKTLYAS